MTHVIRPGVPVVISAPSGTGKTTLCRHVMSRLEHVEYSVSTTTRPPRPREKNGVDYHFVDDATFDRMVREDAFLEWAHVHDRRYGTGRAATESILASGKDLLFDIDVQGGRQIGSQLPGAALVFVLPPSWKVLEARLRGRQSDSEAQIARRLEVARREVEQAVELYRYWIVNDDLDAALEQLCGIVLAERTVRIDPRAWLDALGERS